MKGLVLNQDECSYWSFLVCFHFHSNTHLWKKFYANKAHLNFFWRKYYSRYYCSNSCSQFSTFTLVILKTIGGSGVKAQYSCLKAGWINSMVQFVLQSSQGTSMRLDLIWIHLFTAHSSPQIYFPPLQISPWSTLLTNCLHTNPSFRLFFKEIKPKTNNLKIRWKQLNYVPWPYVFDIISIVDKNT